MKLFYSPNSPYARKCLVAAFELGLRERIETIAANATPTKMDPDIAARNPLGKVPTLILDDATAIYDSPVIAEYFNALAGGELVPRDEAARWNVLTEQALADGMVDAAILARFETALRPENLRWNDWTTGQVAKVVGGLDELERRSGVSATASISGRSPSAARSATSTCASGISNGARPGPGPPHGSRNSAAASRW